MYILLLNKSLLLLGLTCYQFFSIYCRITLHYLLPFCPIDEQDPNPFSNSDISYGWPQDNLQILIWMTSRWFADTHMDDLKMICRYLLITAHFFKNRRTFLTNCIQEKLITTSISSILCLSQHFFLVYIQLYLETSIHDFKFFESHTFEKAWLIGLELCQKQWMSHNMTKQFRSEISRINNNHTSKLQSKFISLCNKSCWKDLSRADLVKNISSISLSSVATKALSFKLKFATGIRNHDMGKLFNTKDSYKVSSPYPLIVILMNWPYQTDT